MKKLYLFGLFFSFTSNSFALSGSIEENFHIIEARTAWSNPPFIWDDDERLPFYNSLCRDLVKDLPKTFTINYSVDEQSGYITASVNYFGIKTSFSGGKWNVLFPNTPGRMYYDTVVFNSDLAEPLKHKSIKTMQLEFFKPGLQTYLFNNMEFAIEVSGKSDAAIPFNCYLFNASHVKI